MLYYPWRDENCLMKDDETYTERYETLKKKIDECRLRFEPYAIAEQYLQDSQQKGRQMGPAGIRKSTS